MTFRKVMIEKNKDSKEIKLVNEEIAQFINVADSKNFVALVEKTVLEMQKLEFQKAISLINELKFSGELPTDEQIEKADDAKVAIELINTTLAKIETIETANNNIISIVACHLLNKSYYLGVAELDTLLRNFQSALISDKGTLVLDESVRKVFSEIKKVLGTICECYNTSKDFTFKEFKPRFNDRHVIDLCMWFYKDITRNKDTGYFNVAFQTDGNKKTNYAPLQSYIQRMVMYVMQKTTK